MYCTLGPYTGVRITPRSNALPVLYRIVVREWLMTIITQLSITPGHKVPSDRLLDRQTVTQYYVVYVHSVELELTEICREWEIHKCILRSN